ncbi:undecaprenyl-diphosphate phosphatase [Candidatus Bipolaricaulota bacterium]|nr:undecaprenyl-diphosphate phosphatase [Candidatus Bipolaricaulota bacterium]
MIRYMLLGLVQGFTEFLPVSSSGHLVLAEHLLNLDPPGVLLETMLHWGTLAAVLIVFRQDIVSLLKSLRGKGRVEQRKEVGFLIVGTVPVVAVGLLLRETIQSAFSSLIGVGIGLLITATLLAVSYLARRRARRAVIHFPDAVAIGLAQAIAVFPGISRSGTTISVGTLTGLTAAQAARFSFLLAIPALFGAGLLHLPEAVQSLGTQNGAGILLGAACAFGSGWLALRSALALIARGRFWIFAVYCALVGGATIVWSVL